MAPSRDKAKKTLVLVVGVVLSVASLYYVFGDVSWTQVRADLSRIRWHWVAASIAAYWLGLVPLRAQLVRLLLRTTSPIPFARAYRALCIGFLVNNVLPARMGDVVRSAAIARAGGARLSTVIGALAFERMADFLMVGLIAFAAIVTVDAVPQQIRVGAAISAGGIAAAFAVFAWLVSRNMEEKTDRSGLFAWLWNLWVRFSKGFEVLRRPASAATALGFSAALWTAGVLSILFKLAAFGLPMAPSWAFLLFACLGFGVSLPSAPGYIGVYQAAVVFALTAVHVNESTAAAFALFSWAVDIAVGNVLGALSMPFEGIDRRQLWRLTESKGGADAA